MSTLRINNIEAKSVPASPTIDEKIKLTNSSGDVLVHVDGKTSGITTIGINTTAGNITFDANSNVVVTGIITATKFVGAFEPTDLNVSGRLLLGTTTEGHPAADELTIANTANAADMGITLRSATNGQGAIYFSDGTSGADEYRGIINYNHTNNFFSFYTDASESFRIDSSGRLLLGTTTEGFQNADDLTIANSGECGITIRSGTSNGGHIYFSDGTSGTSEYMGILYYDHSNNFMGFWTNGDSEKMRITSDGNLGIGYQYPTVKLHASKSYSAPTGGFDSNIVAAFTNSGANSYAGLAIQGGSGAGSFIHFGDTDDSNIGIINYEHSDNSFRFTTNTSEKFQINANGAFGLAGSNYGTSGQVLTSQGSGSAVQWASPSGGHTETYAHVIFGAVYDTNSGYILHNITSVTSNGITPDTSNEKLTPTVAGRYLIIYNAHWNGLYSSGTTYYNRITKNGSEEQRSTFSAYNSGSHMHTVMCTTAMNGSSDYIQFEFYENKSGNTAAHVTALSRAVMILLDT